MRRGQPAQEFRAHLIIRLVSLAALVVWLAAGVLATWYVLPLASFVSIAFFVVFFLIFVTHYWQMAYVVDEYGVSIRSPTDFVHHAWEDIEQIRSSEFPLGGYYVATKNGGFVISHFLKGRDVLVDIVIARAGLFPLSD